MISSFIQITNHQIHYFISRIKNYLLSIIFHFEIIYLLNVTQNVFERESCSIDEGSHDRELIELSKILLKIILNSY